MSLNGTIFEHYIHTISYILRRMFPFLKKGFQRESRTYAKNDDEKILRNERFEKLWHIQIILGSWHKSTYYSVPQLFVQTAIFVYFLVLDFTNSQVDM